MASVTPPCCVACGTPYDLSVFDALEPMLTLEQSAEILGITTSSIYQFLAKHPEVPRRYKQGRARRVRRMLYASEIRYLRDIRLWTIGPDGGRKKKIRVIDSPLAKWTYPTIDATEARKNLRFWAEKAEQKRAYEVTFGDEKTL